MVTIEPGGNAWIERFAGSNHGTQRFDVVITDLGMPDVDGRQVARAVKQPSPLTPVILLTGWGQRLVSEGTPQMFREGGGRFRRNGFRPSRR